MKMGIKNQHIEDWTLEEFCLGLLPQHEAEHIVQLATEDMPLRERIKNIEDMLKNSCSITPKPATKQSLFSLLDDVENMEVDVNNAPMINRFSDAAAWNNAVKNFRPLHQEEGLGIYPIRTDDKVELSVAWLSDVLDESGHGADDFEESFLILEGACECNIAGEMFYLQAGDFLTIPPNVRHSIKNTSPNGMPVKGMLQRRKALL